MKVRPIVTWAVASLALALPAAAGAKVHEVSDAGFVIRLTGDVAAAPDAVWQDLVRPGGWWAKEHTYSGNAENLAIDPIAGGCFCEVIPDPASPRASPHGSVEHMRVVYAERGRVLRLSGGLGPLQAEAANGTLTMFLKPVEGGTRIMWEYVVGGYMRTKPAVIAPAVDAVLAQQLGRLVGRIGPLAPAVNAPAERPDEAAQPGRMSEGR